MTKRANGEGTIRQRKDGAWEARYTGMDGRQRSVYAKTTLKISTQAAGYSKRAAVESLDDLLTGAQ